MIALAWQCAAADVSQATVYLVRCGNTLKLKRAQHLMPCRVAGPVTHYDV